MIKIFSVKVGQQEKIEWYTKKATQRALTKQINKGLKLGPEHADEYHTLHVTIDDNPVKRFLMKLFKKDDKNMPVTLEAEFQRYKGLGVTSHKTYRFNDTFTMSQIHELDKGKNLLDKKDSFVHRLVNNVNEAMRQKID